MLLSSRRPEPFFGPLGVKTRCQMERMFLPCASMSSAHAGLSLERTQAYGSVDVAAAREQGLERVRQVTGGPGVLHHGELTYSFVARVAPPFTDSIEQNDTLLSEATTLEPSRPELSPTNGTCVLTQALEEFQERWG
jgi:hypothetical protein